MKTFYQMSPDEVKISVNGSTEPLTEEQVAQSQEKYGPNEIAEGKKKSLFLVFLEQFKDFLVIILIIAAVVSGVLGDIESSLVILMLPS